MEQLTLEYIKNSIADSKVIYKRGEGIFHLGNYSLETADPDKKFYTYAVTGSYGDYEVSIRLGETIEAECNCPYPKPGCKHVVAVCLDVSERLGKSKAPVLDDGEPARDSSSFLTFEEIREEVLENRRNAAKWEEFEIVWGDTCKGEHSIVTKDKKEYRIVLHDPAAGKGHCNCPDYTHNRLSTCKHLVHILEKVKKDKRLLEQSTEETMPFIHVFWDSYKQKPCYFFDEKIEPDLKKTLDCYFDENGSYKKRDIGELYTLLTNTQSNQGIRIDGYVRKRVEDMLFLREIFSIKKRYQADYSQIKATLYPYQKEGIQFCVFKTRAIIADEMGLGKTLQAITAAVIKKDLFGFKRALIVCPASLKEQWKREIERFTGMKAVIVSGSYKTRQKLYESDPAFFLITNYEAVLRDITVIRRCAPDLVILDEAQRIKNFNSKTHQAVLSIPKKQSLVITGTPLENKLEDLYGIVQFSDPELLSPFWIFSATYLKLSKEKKKICGYANLDALKSQLANIVIRRKKEDVLDSLPEQVTNVYYVGLAEEQRTIHQGYFSALLPLLDKKIHTPLDIQRIHQILLCMRMVCNSTFLIDQKTNVSPKLAELAEIIRELAIENKRKVVIFSEWTTMTYLIGKMLSGLGIEFVEFTGKIPVDRRQKLITEFETNPDCKVFLSTDAGGLGLNLQVADCVINVELPWNPAKLNQRIGRVNRIGQKSACINVINLIAKDSIEERVAAGIAAKLELFNAVFEEGASEVDFSESKKTSFINGIRTLLNEEPLMPPHEKSLSVEIEDDTPHFRNPVVLDEEAELDFGLEEGSWEDDSEALGSADGIPGEVPPSLVNQAGESDAHAPDPAVMEEVLNNGLKFLSGLSAMVSGKPLAIDDESKAVSVDRITGEVTLKFRIPGFGGK